MRYFPRLSIMFLMLTLAASGAGSWACDAEKALAGGAKEKCASHAAQQAKILKAAETVEFVGRVLCGSCDLKQQGKHCTLVFRTEGEAEAVYTLVENDTLADLAKVTSHGEILVSVTGKAVSSEKVRLLSIESFSIRG